MKKMNRTLMITCLTAHLFCLPQAFANKTGNGGDSIQNHNGTRSLLDLVETDQIDYFTYNAVDYTNHIVNEQGWDHDVASDIDLLSSLSPDVPSRDLGNYFSSDLLTNALRSCLNPVHGLHFAWTVVPLEKVSDEGEIRLPSTVTERQLAIQKDGLVVVNKNEFRQIDSLSQGVLKLHEGMICAILKLNPQLIASQGTAPIRSYVRAFTEIRTLGKPSYVLDEAYKNLGLSK
jgi:hypothetical protein